MYVRLLQRDISSNSAGSGSLKVSSKRIIHKQQSVKSVLEVPVSLKASLLNLETAIAVDEKLWKSKCICNVNVNIT